VARSCPQRLLFFLVFVQRSVLWRLLLLFTALLVFKTPAGIRLTEKITSAMTHLLPLQKLEIFMSMYSHLVLTLLLLMMEYIYWMRGQLLVPSLTTKVILRILFTYLPMMYVFPLFPPHSSSFSTNRTYNLFLMVFAPIQLSS
jgi:hypothetical protein